LRRWLAAPLAERSSILDRQQAVQVGGGGEGGGTNGEATGLNGRGDGEGDGCLVSKMQGSPSQQPYEVSARLWLRAFECAGYTITNKGVLRCSRAAYGR
jgi:hypothetical protein